MVYEELQWLRAAAKFCVKRRSYLVGIEFLSKNKICKNVKKLTSLEVTFRHNQSCSSFLIRICGSFVKIGSIFGNWMCILGAFLPLQIRWVPACFRFDLLFTTKWPKSLSISPFWRNSFSLCFLFFFFFLYSISYNLKASTWIYLREKYCGQNTAWGFCFQKCHAAAVWVQRSLVIKVCLHLCFEEEAIAFSFFSL